MFGAFTKGLTRSSRSARSTDVVRPAASATIYLSALLAAACVDGAPAEPVETRSAALTTSGLFYQGVNLTGAERGFGAAIEETWGAAIPGVEGSTYVWPNPDLNTNVSVLDSALFPGGVNTVRLPFQWERLQPVLSGPFDSGYLAKLKATAEALRKRGATVLLDVHNYGYYKRNNRGTSQPGQHIGSADVPIAAFVDLWRRLAQEFGSASKSHPYVFGLMNEPHDIAVSVWVDAARQALTAIRGTGAKNLILVPGADWTTASDFSWSQNRNLLQSITDPDDNMAIDVHQYYDDACAANGYVDKLRPFEEWAVANRRFAWLSEMDVPEASDACKQAFANLLTHLHAKAAGTNGGVWSGYVYWVIDASSTTSGASFVSTPLPLLRPHLPGTCGSRARDGQETDVDCGGTCRRCADGRGCTKDTDCQSGFCSGNVCAGAGGTGGAAGGGGGRGGAGGTGTGGSAGATGSAGTTGMAGAIAGGGGRGGVMGTGGSAGTTGSAGTIGAAGASGTTGGGGSTGTAGSIGTAGASAGTNTSGGRGGSHAAAGGEAGADNSAGCACSVARTDNRPTLILYWLLGAALVRTRGGRRSTRRGDNHARHHAGSIVAALRFVAVLAAFSSGIACKDGGASKSDKSTAYEPSEPCTPLPPIGRRLWRLSAQQYANSVRDLLDLDTPPVLATTGGTSEAAFFSDSSATVDENLAFQLNLTARKVTAALGPRIPALAACTSGESEDACARRFAGRFAALAFRRPVDESEITALIAVYAEGRQQDFATGISLVIQALLQSPAFIFRSELGSGAGDSTLTGHEVATQLAYMFLDSTPDEGLLAAAAEGRLTQPEGIAAEVDRLLSLDAVKRNITRIVLDWFNTRQAFIIAKAPEHFFALPAADRNQALLQQDVYASARALVDDVLWTRGDSLTSLITTERMFVNWRLATLLDLPFTASAPEEMQAVDTIPGERAGLLTHPAVLWAASGTDQTSIVRRGILLHNDVVCADSLPFPEGLINSPDVQAALAMFPTEIEKSDYRLATPPCKGCHSQIDPFGLVLENFDAVGRYRTEAEGWVVNPTADFSAMPGIGRVVHGPIDLAKAIVESRQFLGCAAQKMASYAIGRMIRAYNTCEVRAMRAELSSSDGTASALFRQVATASFLRSRSGGAP